VDQTLSGSGFNSDWRKHRERIFIMPLSPKTMLLIMGAAAVATQAGCPLTLLAGPAIWEAVKGGVGEVFGGYLHEALKGEARATISDETAKTIASLIREFAREHRERRSLENITKNAPKQWAAMHDEPVTEQEIQEIITGLRPMDESDRFFSAVEWRVITSWLCREYTDDWGSGGMSGRLAVQLETVTELAEFLAAHFPTRIQQAFEEAAARGTGAHHQMVLRLLVDVLKNVQKPPATLPMAPAANVEELKSALEAAVVTSYKKLSAEERTEIAALTVEIQALDATLWNRLNNLHTDVKKIDAGVEELLRRTPDRSRETVKAAVKSRLMRPPYVYGREEDLRRLRESLTRGGTAAVTQAIAGLGGVGKTTLALEYAHRYADDYDFLLLATADSVGSLERDYRAIADQAALPIPDDTPTKAVVRAVKDFLNATQRTLLILDNADFSANWTPEQLKAFLPESAHGHLLITTRATTLHGGLGVRKSCVLSLDVMEAEEAIRFLITRSKGERATLSAEEANASAELAEALGYLPLALEQAAAYIAPPGRTFSNYLKRFRESSIAHLERKKPEAGDYRATVATTWQISFDEVKRDNPAATDLLTLCAFLASEGIPVEVVYAAVRGTLPAVQAFFESAVDDEARQERYYDLLEPLTRYSLVRVDDKKHTFDVHRLVQEVIRWQMTDAEQIETITRAVQILNAAFPFVKFETWTACERLTNCALTLFIYDMPEKHRDETLADLYNKTAIYLENRGRYREAEPLYVEVVKTVSAFLPEGHPNIAISLGNLALLYNTQGRYSEAEPLFVEALEIYREALPKGHPDIALSLNNLAGLHKAQGRHRQSQLLHNEALTIRRAALPENPLDIAQSLNNLAQLYYSQGSYTNAKSLHDEALEIRRAHLPVGHPDIACSLNNMALLYEALECYSVVEPLYDEELEIYCNALGENHPLTKKVSENFQDFLKKTNSASHRENFARQP
jgi:tetratricopeptide (TPR) repeat protein